jgi:DUF1365 family protein
MTLNSCLYQGWVMHRRYRPRPHHFRYRAFWLLIDLDELAAIADQLRLFSIKGFNLFSFQAGDYGFSNTTLRKGVEAELREAGIELHGGPIRLLTMPRVLGYAFNPISVFYCYRPNGTLAATIYEVHNTFGERHRYVARAEATDRETIRQVSAKTFHVSPFMPMDMRYSFRATPPLEAVALGINASGGGHAMHAVMKATRSPLTDGALLSLFVTHPLVTLKVIGAIHWEALRLWRKRLAVFAHRATHTRVTAGLQHRISGRSHG